MLKTFKKITSLTLGLGILTTTIANASTFNNNLKSNNNSDNIIEQPIDNVVSRSVIPAHGPCKGFIQGKCTAHSRYGNFNRASSAVSIIGSICGLSGKEIWAGSQALIKGLEIIGVGNVYYTMTLFTSPDGLRYYYEYDYYSDEGHHHYLGCTYSYLYGYYA
ncbi:hypothetical protein [Clostridium botulinum]|uniref:hypothetical protein n=1 Tax=Clostridium botulinum TaxID=1491 RepID=UPI0004DA3223|nr:hypothetical protein [Clostridium botulinum]KEI04340.1 hypothetical protein Z952_07205 [Clostridium botulinum C/D str. BKT75002]KEI09332.1 hypothetical protein Z954_13195 [Clostridium botulinum C/D str. BKT2873]